MLSSNEDIYADLEQIQQDIMPKWALVDQAEKQSMKNILNRWEENISTHFKRDKSNMKYMQSFEEVLNSLAGKEIKDYKQSKEKIKELAFDLFRICGGVYEDVFNKETGVLLRHQINISKTQECIKLNTRLMLRAFKKFYLGLDCLEVAKTTNEAKVKCSNLKHFVQHMCKGILRVALYINENAHLNKCSFGSPPIYIVETDDDTGEEPNDQLPTIGVDTLYEYIYLCLCQLDTANKETRRKYGLQQQQQQQQEIQLGSNCAKTAYTNMLYSLIRLTQLVGYIRDLITLKQELYDADACAWCLIHECELMRDCVKYIYKN